MDNTFSPRSMNNIKGNKGNIHGWDYPLLYLGNRSDIGKCIDNVVPRIIVRSFLNQKPWVNGKVLAKLKAWTNNQGDLDEYRTSRYALWRVISSAKRQYSLTTKVSTPGTRGLE